ncbi:MAG: CAP domain-containing protein [Clostridiales bacterium]|jgi:uncharacterized protein YkwD|nr:CAP domain-containing protein [Clostridiales bacterium]
MKKMFKHGFSALLTAALASGVGAVQHDAALAAVPAADNGNPIAVYLDGQPIEFDVPPTIVHDRTMVPFRRIAEAMGAEVIWTDMNKQITMYLNASYVILVVDEPVMTYGDYTADANGNVTLTTNNAYPLDAPPMIMYDRTLVPIRAVTIGLGTSVSWDGNARAVRITTDRQENQETLFTPEPAAPALFTPEPTAPPPEPSSDPDNGYAYRLSVIEFTNAERQRIGNAPLLMDEELMRIAQVRVEAIAQTGVFAHNIPGYGQPWDSLSAFGYQWSRCAENIAEGSATPSGAVNQWMRSSGHKENMLGTGDVSRNLTKIGVGYAKSASGVYWLQLFT